MAYEQPTPASFKARFPEFEQVDDALIQLVLDDAISDVGDTWLEKDRARAQMLLTAHNLVMEGEPDRSTTGESITASGPIKSRRAGDTEEVYAGTGSSVVAAGDGGFSSTTYGQRYLNLMRLNFPAIGVV